MPKKKISKKTDEEEIKEAVVDNNNEQEDDFPDDSDEDDDEDSDDEETPAPVPVVQKEVVEEPTPDLYSIDRKERIKAMEKELADEKAEEAEEQFMKSAPTKIVELETTISEMGKAITDNRKFMIGLSKRIDALGVVAK